MEDFKWDEDLMYEFMNSLWHNDRFKEEDFKKELEYFKQSKEPKPKEYQILEFKHKEPITHVPYKSNIHSVKRLSDGQIFSVGDKVVHKTDGSINTAKILGFTIPKTSNSIWFTFEPDTDFVKDLNNFVKAKEVLFTTEDGVPVYLDQRVWWVRIHDFELDFHDFYNGESWFPDRFKYFSTKEVAEDWILMNKPVHSTKEVIEMFRCQEHSYFKEALTDLAKSKL